ncbi:MAG: phosphotransferase [Ignisphaera sp.]
MEIDLNELGKWLKRARWWPKDREVVSILDHEFYRDGEYLILLIVDDNGYRYFVPLKKVNKDIYVSVSLEINGDIYVEADLVEPFLLRARNIIDCEHLYILPKCLFDKVELVTDSSNVVTIALSDKEECRIVVKSYRLVSTDRIELKIARYLMAKGFRYIPKIYSVCRYRGYTIGLSLEYVEGVNGGLPFYESLLNLLRRGIESNIHDLDYSVGRTVAELHKVFALSDDAFFSSELFTIEDTELWGKRLEEIANRLLHNLDTLHTEDRIDGFWIEAIDKRVPVWIERAFNAFVIFSETKKILCHSDLHLGQMVYSSDRGFTIVDFEGEPLFLSRDRYLKSHGFRDIASLIRSLDYILFAGVKEVYGMDIDSIAKKFAKYGWGEARKWRDAHASSIVMSYIHNLARESLLEIVLGFRSIPRDLYRYITPWYIYRVFYEALYESIYRPHNLPIPLHVLIWDPEDIVMGIGGGI